MADKVSRKTKILDATAGTGIRGIRYLLEAKAKGITMLDMNASAYKEAKKNVTANKVKIKVINTSIQEFANTTRERFDFIDVDPFGGISPYVYDMMKISKDGTYLMLTSTDTAVLCGAHAEACMKLYGSKPMHNELCHEAGIRILINFVAGIAAQFNFGIRVMMSVSYAHYMRVFLKLEHGSANALATLKRTGYLHYCRKCGSRTWETRFIPKESKCIECGSDVSSAGRMWLGNLYDKAETKRMLGYFVERFPVSKEIAFMRTIDQEADLPFFYSIPETTRMMHIESVSPIEVIKRLKGKGYTATRTHFNSDAVKTDAGMDAVKKCIMSKRSK